jgi:hypothetical protein
MACFGGYVTFRVRCKKYTLHNITYEQNSQIHPIKEARIVYTATKIEKNSWLKRLKVLPTIYWGSPAI